MEAPNRPTFPMKLHSILEDASHSDIIRWEHIEGMTNVFRIVDVHKFEENIIPSYFRHGKMSSVQRQLNLYGFRCIAKGGAHKGSFYHADFRRDDFNSVCNMRRLIAPVPHRTSASGGGGVNQRKTKAKGNHRRHKKRRSKYDDDDDDEDDDDQDDHGDEDEQGEEETTDEVADEPEDRAHTEPQRQLQPQSQTQLQLQLQPPTQIYSKMKPMLQEEPIVRVTLSTVGLPISQSPLHYPSNAQNSTPVGCYISPSQLNRVASYYHQSGHSYPSKGPTREGGLPTVSSTIAFDAFSSDETSAPSTYFQLRHAGTIEDLTKMCGELDDFYMQRHTVKFPMESDAALSI
jgi:HSF-type DNA-binding